MNRLATFLFMVWFSVFPDALAQEPGSSGSVLTFTDVAREVGISTPTIFGGRTTNEYILETTGSGAAFLDYNNDGWLDIFLVNGITLDGNESPPPSNRLYGNNRDGTFTDVTRHAGVGISGWGQGVCVGDIDNDGFEDLLVTYWGQNVLYRNNRDGTFTEETKWAGLLAKETRWGAGCSFLDYNRDSFLDLVVANYIDFSLKTVPSPGTGNCRFYDLAVNCGPRGLPKARNYLYRNTGDGRFVDVTEASGFGKSPPSYGLGVLTADFDDDGWPDIYVANDSDPSYLYWNNGDGTFTEDGMAAGVATSADGRNQSGMGVSSGDFDRDGQLDIFKTNFSEDLPNLYRNQGDRFFEEVTIEAGLGVNSRYLGWGCGFLDADNDGWQDIFYVNGHVYPEIDTLKRPIGYRQPKVLYQNSRDGSFRDISMDAGAAIVEPAAARGAAFGDFDNDGDIDILINPINQIPQLLRNDCRSGNNWIQLKLIGTSSNRSAIGARVRCIVGTERQIREVQSGGSYYSQSDLRVHFGVGKASQIDLIEIRWPSGNVDHLKNVEVNRLIAVEEGGKILD